MFLATAGKAYSRKTPEEEFTLYLHGCGVMSTLKSALVHLYELPIKPQDINEYFAEFLENRAQDLLEISNLRAELCFKKSEAQDIRRRHAAMDKELEEFESNPTKGPLKDLKDHDERQYEIMKRFLKDLQVYHPSMFLSRGSIVTREDELTCAGEAETTACGLDQNCVKEKEQPLPKKEEESYEKFVEDMKKFDPWGMVFPSIIPGPGEKKVDGQLPRRHDRCHRKIEGESEENEMVLNQLGLSTKRNNKDSQQQARPLKADDDSKSLAELIHKQKMFEEEAQQQAEEAHNYPQGFYTWDREYWKQFLQDGNFNSDVGFIPILETTSPHPPSARKGSYPGVELQFFNPSRFSEDSAASYGDVRQLLELHAKNMKLEREPEEIRQSPATQNYYLKQVWTTPRYAYGPLADAADLTTGTSSDPRKDSSASAARPPLLRAFSKTNLLKLKPHHADDNSWMADVIKTDVSYGDPPLHCKRPLRSYSKEPPKQASVPKSSRSASPCGGASRFKADKEVKTTSSKPTAVVPTDFVANRPIPSAQKPIPSSTSITQAHISRKTLDLQFESQRGKSELKFNVQEQDVTSEPDGHHHQHGSNNKTSTPTYKSSLKQLPNTPNQAHHAFLEVPPPEYRRRSSARTSIMAGSLRGRKSDAAVYEHVLPDSLPRKSGDTMTEHGPRKSSVFIDSDPSTFSFEGLMTSGSTATGGGSRSTTKRSTLPSNLGDPCDPKNVANFHPYPDLLVERRTQDSKKDGGGSKRFIQFCRQHYDQEYIQRLQKDYDFSLFEDM